MKNQGIKLSDELLEKISGGIFVKDGDWYRVVSDDDEETTYPYPPPLRPKTSPSG